MLNRFLESSQRSHGQPKIVMRIEIRGPDVDSNLQVLDRFVELASVHQQGAEIAPCLVAARIQPNALAILCQGLIGPSLFVQHHAECIISIRRGCRVQAAAE